MGTRRSFSFFDVPMTPNFFMVLLSHAVTSSLMSRPTVVAACRD
jgi:hypothetical protein